MERPRVYDRRHILDAREQEVAQQQNQSLQSQKKVLSRRNFLFGAAALGGAAALRSSNEEAPSDLALEDPEQESEPAVESIETFPSSEVFESERLGWQKWWELQYNQILFVDKQGAPVGEPVDFENFTVKRTRTEEDGTFTEFDYRLAPGALTDSGMLADNIAGEWLRYVQAQHAREFDISTDALTQRNITQEFEVAVARGDTEPELRESILDAVNGGNGIETMGDIVRYYGMNPDKTVTGDYEGRTRAQYLQQEITFHTKLPELVQDELRGFIVGLAAQESRFNAGLPKNSATAEGVLQLVDAVREENGHDPSARLSFAQEIDVCGEHFSNVYSRVGHWMKHELVRNPNGGVVEQDRPETYQMLRGLFSEDSQGEQEWQKYFLVPCMVNAYNAGSWTIGACLHEFVAAHSQEELQAMLGENPGYDLFTKFTHFAKESQANEFTRNYGEDAQAYFVSIAAATESLSEEFESIEYEDREIASL